MIDADVSVEVRTVSVSALGHYDAIEAPDKQGQLGGGFGAAAGVRLFRVLTPLVGFEHGWLGCSDCEATFDALFFGVRFDSPNRGMIGFHAEVDAGYRAVHEKGSRPYIVSLLVYHDSYVGVPYDDTWRWSGFEPRLAVGPSFRLSPMFSLDLSATAALGTFTSSRRPPHYTEPFSLGEIETTSTIPSDRRRTHAFVGLTLSFRVLLPISRRGPSASP